jgi:hypothetical protein
VRQALLGADHRDGLRIRVEVHAVATLVPLGDGGAQVRYAAGSGVAVVARVPRGLADLLDHVRGRRQVGVAHAEVDDVLAGAPRRLHQVDDLRQHVGRQAVQLVEVVADRMRHGGPLIALIY